MEPGRRAGLTVVVVTLLIFSAHISNCEDTAGRTKIVVLGVEHAAQLVAPTYQPAEFIAFFNRVKPAAICIERDPDDYARGDFYDFTYEQQNIAIPYGQKDKIPIFPIDWLPSSDDSMLVWAIPDITAPPFLRNPSGFRGFIVFDDHNDLSRTLFFAEQSSERAQADSWYDSKRALGERDFPRRLELYRTFMQAMRVKAAARRFPARTVLVIVGAMHKYDMEQILSSDGAFDIVQPSSFGQPANSEIDRELRREDLAAIASFNLLGVQSGTGNIDWQWLETVVNKLQSQSPGPETDLFLTRYKILRGGLSPAEASSVYEGLLERARTVSWTYTGVTDSLRVDSYFDPFGNLSFQQRLWLELARENHKLKHLDQGDMWREKLFHDPTLTEFKRAQISGYWKRYVDEMK